MRATSLDDMDLTVPDSDVPPLPDRHADAIAALENKLSLIGNKMRGSWREFCRLHLQGLNHKAIAERTGATPHTVSRVLSREVCQRYIAALQARVAYLEGPSLQARLALLWRIAVTHEEGNPRVAIQAVDAYNKTQGVYAEQNKEVAKEAPRIQVIQNFIIDPDAAPAHLQRATYRDDADAIEGEFEKFEPIALELPDA